MQKIVKKDLGRARQNSLATARTNVNKPGARNKVVLCIFTWSVMTYDSTGSALHWAACSLPLSEICNRCSVKDQNRMSPQQILLVVLSTGKRACVSESQSGGDKNSLAQALFASEVALLRYFVALLCHGGMIGTVLIQLWCETSIQSYNGWKLSFHEVITKFPSVAENWKFFSGCVGCTGLIRAARSS